MKTWFLDNHAAMMQAFFAALMVPLTLSLTALGIYFANATELPGNPGSVCLSIGLQTLIGVLLLFIVQIPFFGRKAFSWIAVTLFTLGFLFWFQANVFNWNFGVLDGREIDWNSYRFLGIFELFVYGVIFCLALRFRKKLFEHLVSIACVLIFIQAVPVSLAILATSTQETALRTDQTEDQPEHNIFAPTWKQYSYTLENFFEFSPEENVVLIVLDSMGKKILEDIQKEYSTEIEEIFHDFRDFTYFTNTICDKAGTMYCIPQILTACSSVEIPSIINATFQHKVFNRSGALLKTLSEQHYRCDVFSYSPAEIYYDSRWIANVRLNECWRYPADTSELTILTLFRSAPTLLKRKVLKSTTLRIMFDFTSKSSSSYRPLSPTMPEDYEINTIVHTVSRTALASQRTFKLVFLRGAHSKFVMDENCMPAKLSGIEGQKRQALGSLRVTQNILELMKECGVYDQSLVIVMADHGPREDEHIKQDPSAPKRPIFLIKRKHSQQSQMAYNDNPIHIRDTTPIILSELGILQSEDAFSPFEMPEVLVNERKKQWESICNSPKRN